MTKGPPAAVLGAVIDMSLWRTGRPSAFPALVRRQGFLAANGRYRGAGCKGGAAVSVTAVVLAATAAVL
jgi:hypothetical protein